jgi:hypothetical protein
MSRTLALLFLLGLLAVGCTATPGASGAARPPPRPSVSPDLPPTVPPSDAPITGEVPEAVLEAVRTRLTTDTGLDAATAVVKVAEAVQWNDGSLGCAKPGEMYTQAIVDGYHVVLTIGDTDYDFRVDAQNGFIVRCEQRGPISS